MNRKGEKITLISESQLTNTHGMVVSEGQHLMGISIVIQARKVDRGRNREGKRRKMKFSVSQGNAIKSSHYQVWDKSKVYGPRQDVKVLSSLKSQP